MEETFHLTDPKTIEIVCILRFCDFLPNIVAPRPYSSQEMLWTSSVRSSSIPPLQGLGGWVGWFWSLGSAVEGLETFRVCLTGERGGCGVEALGLGLRGITFWFYGLGVSGLPVRSLVWHLTALYGRCGSTRLDTQSPAFPVFSEICAAPWRKAAYHELEI